MQYDTFVRGGVSVALEIIGAWAAESQPERLSRRIEEIKTRIRNTLDIVPVSHIALFGTIKLTDRLRSGGGHNPNIPHVQLSYDCFDHAYNQTAHSYTMLHEMGHMVDKKLYPSTSRIEALMRGFPLGCLSMLSRYHSGGTVGPSEHYADIYADYFYTQIGSHQYGLHRRDGEGCPSCRNEAITRRGRDGSSVQIFNHQCRNYRNRCERSLGDSSHLLPQGQGLTALRFRALLMSWGSIGIQNPSSSPEADVPAVAPNCAIREPCAPSRSRYYEPTD